MSAINGLRDHHLSEAIKRKPVYLSMSGLDAMMTGCNAIIVKGITISLVYSDGTKESAKDKGICEAVRASLIRQETPDYREGESLDFNIFNIVSFVQSKRSK